MGNPFLTARITTRPAVPGHVAIGTQHSAVPAAPMIPSPQTMGSHSPEPSLTFRLTLRRQVLSVDEL